MRLRLRSVMLTEEEIRLRRRLYTKDGYTLVDFINFRKVVERLAGNKEEIQTTARVEHVPNEDRLSYIIEAVQWIKDNKCGVLTIPDDSKDAGFAKCWLCVRGSVQNCENFGIVSSFVINLSLVRIPCIIVRRDFLPELNQRCFDADHDTYSYNDLLVKPNTYCCGWEPDITNTVWCKKCFSISSMLHSSKNFLMDDYAKFILHSGMYEPASYQFKRIPGTIFLASPLSPIDYYLDASAVDGKKRECFISSWDILYPTEIIRNGTK
jgi:hypothetical protein